MRDMLLNFHILGGMIQDFIPEESEHLVVLLLSSYGKCNFPFSVIRHGSSKKCFSQSPSSRCTPPHFGSVAVNLDPHNNQNSFFPTSIVSIFFAGLLTYDAPYYHAAIIVLVSVKVSLCSLVEVFLF